MALFRKEIIDKFKHEITWESFKDELTPEEISCVNDFASAMSTPAQERASSDLDTKMWKSFVDGQITIDELLEQSINSPELSSPAAIVMFVISKQDIPRLMLFNQATRWNEVVNTFAMLSLMARKMNDFLYDEKKKAGLLARNWEHDCKWEYEKPNV
jgi:hypothetical protein